MQFTSRRSAAGSRAPRRPSDRCWRETNARWEEITPRVAQSLFDLGKLRADTGGPGDLPAAEAQTRRGLAIYRSKPDTDSFDLASGLADLGAVLCQHGNAAEGWPLLDEAVAIWTRDPSPYSPDLRELAPSARRCRGTRV